MSFMSNISCFLLFCSTLFSFACTEYFEWDKATFHFSVHACCVGMKYCHRLIKTKKIIWNFVIIRKGSTIPIDMRWRCCCETITLANATHLLHSFCNKLPVQARRAIISTMFFGLVCDAWKKWKESSNHKSKWFICKCTHNVNIGDNE